MFFLAYSCMAQSRLWLMPTIPSDTSIVREWKSNGYIVYTRQGTNQSISYHNNVSPVVQTAQIPSRLIINDFRIYGDMVFAGGTEVGTPYSKGILLCFPISDLLGGGGTFKVLYLGGTTLDSVNSPRCSNEIGSGVYADADAMGVKRLSVFHDGEVTRVAYIADDTVTSGGVPVGGRRIGYGDVEYAGNWGGGWFNYNKDAENQFTDITVTDSHVVLVSHDCMYKRLEIVLHDKVGGYANTAPIVTDIYYFTDHNVVGRVMVAAMEGNGFAVAYHYEKPGIGAGLAVKVFNVSAGVPSLQYSLEIPSAGFLSTGSEMRDIRYVQSTGELWVLNDMVSPVTGMGGSYIYRVDMGNVYAGIYEARYLSGCKLPSLDGITSGGYAVSGTTAGSLQVHVEQNAPALMHCSSAEMVKGVPTSPVMHVYGRAICPIWLYKYQKTIEFTVNELPAVKQCEK